MKPIRQSIFPFTVSAPEGRPEGEGDGEEGIKDGTTANMDEDGIVEYEPTDPGDDDKAVDVVRVVEVESKDEQDLLCHPCGDERLPKILQTPMKPSKDDVNAHFAMHLPYRSWCPACVKAKLREDGHYRVKQDKKQDGLPIVSMDYQDMNEESKKQQKVIIGKDEVSGSTFGHYVLCKGVGDEWAAKQIVKDIQELGYGDIILKTDGDPAIVALQNKMQSMRQAKTVPRNPPAYNPQSNGPCEKAVQDVTAHMRALVIGLEARIGTPIPENSPMFQWAIEHATFLLNHYNVGKDGMTHLK